MEHAVQHPEQHTDPILGPVWVRVGCELCGAVGRYDSEGIASAHADKHNRKWVKQ